MEFEQRLASYYSILGVSTDSSDEEIRRAYRKLAMQWHPDKWTRTPSILGEAKRRFQQVQEAYSVLSDHNKRTVYDAGLYNPDEEEDEGFLDFLQEMMSLIADARREEKSYSMEELQSMFWEMAKDFEFPERLNCPQQHAYESNRWFGRPLTNDTRTSKRARCDTSPIERSSTLHFSGLEMSGPSRFCR